MQACTYDWVHTFLQGGIFQVEVELMLQAARGNSLMSRRDVQNMLQETWRWPRHSAVKQRQLHRIFDDRRAGEDDKVKCTCAEALGVYGMIRHTHTHTSIVGSNMCQASRKCMCGAMLRHRFA